MAEGTIHLYCHLVLVIQQNHNFVLNSAVPDFKRIKFNLLTLGNRHCALLFLIPQLGVRIFPHLLQTMNDLTFEYSLFLIKRLCLAGENVFCLNERVLKKRLLLYMANVSIKHNTYN